MISIAARSKRGQLRYITTFCPPDGPWSTIGPNSTCCDLLWMCCATNCTTNPHQVESHQQTHIKLYGRHESRSPYQIEGKFTASQHVEMSYSLLYDLLSYKSATSRSSGVRVIYCWYIEWSPWPDLQVAATSASIAVHLCSVPPDAVALFNCNSALPLTHRKSTSRHLTRVCLNSQLHESVFDACL